MDNFPEERRQLIIEQSAIIAQMSKLKKANPIRKQMVVRYHEIVSRLTAMKLAVRHYRSDDAVTDHALIRWLERKHKIDVSRLKKIMLSPGLDFATKSGEKYYSDGDLMYVIDYGAVQTVIPITKQEHVAA